MSTLYRFAFLSICFLGCSSDVVDENAVPMTNFSAVRDMAVPSPGPLNIPSSGGMPEMIQGGEMVVAGTKADEMMPDAPGGMPAGGTVLPRRAPRTDMIFPHTLHRILRILPSTFESAMV